MTSSSVIDLRSDTATKPTPGMLAAMAAAEVGDEQEREDPTTNELQRRIAELLGHEAALFLPTATMGNQVALRVLSKPGCKVVAEERTHVLIYEWGGPAIHSGLVMHGLAAEAGRLTPEQILEVDEFGPGGVLVLENTHRSSGGRVWPLDEFGTAVGAARERGAAVHLDGARLFNAAVAAGEPVSAWSSRADSVTVCFSKGLGCPFGAVLAGSAELIERAWEGKFLFGGALRQSGVAAAAMIYALDHHVERLADDHARAKHLAEGIGLDPADVDTNFVQIRAEPGLRERLAERGVRVGGLRPGWLRAVTHLDIGDDDIDAAIPAMQEVLGVHA
jgi:threonine aldolase